MSDSSSRSHLSTCPLAFAVLMLSLSSMTSPSLLFMWVISRVSLNSKRAIPSKHFFKWGWTLKKSRISSLRKYVTNKTAFLINTKNVPLVPALFAQTYLINQLSNLTKSGRTYIVHRSISLTSQSFTPTLTSLWNDPIYWCLIHIDCTATEHIKAHN